MPGLPAMSATSDSVMDNFHKKCPHNSSSYLYMYIYIKIKRQKEPHPAFWLLEEI